MFQSKCSTYCSAADKELYCDPHTQSFMLTVKSSDSSCIWIFDILSVSITRISQSFSELLLKKVARCFCCRWARGGRMLMSLCSIQLVEPFASSLAWAAIYVMVLNLIFIVLFLQTFFSAVGYLPFFCTSVYCKELLQMFCFFFPQSSSCRMFPSALYGAHQPWKQKTPYANFYL